MGEFIDEGGKIQGDLNPRFQLAQYDQGLTTELSPKALTLLEILTNTNVIELEYTRNRKIIDGTVLLEENELERLGYGR